MKLIKDEQTAKEGTQRNSERERKRVGGMEWLFSFWFMYLFEVLSISIKGLRYKTITCRS